MQAERGVAKPEAIRLLEGAPFRGGMARRVPLVPATKDIEVAAWQS